MMINEITKLKKTIEQQKAIINFQEAQHKIMVDLAVNREKVINRLKQQELALEDELETEQDLHASMIKLAEQTNES